MRVSYDVAGKVFFQMEMASPLILEMQDGQDSSPLLREWCNRMMILPTPKCWIFPLQVVALLIVHPLY